MTYAYTATERKRVSFGKIPEAMELPNLISVQRESFERFKDEGLREAFKESSPIQSQNHVLEVTFGEHQFGDPAHTVEECREKDMTYQAPLLTDVRLTNKETGEIKEQLVFMGDFPMMTDQGTFIINGTERIVVSQLVRSPGVYYSSEMDSGKQIYKAQIIPSRGAWLEFEVDKRDQLMVSIDRKRKQSATMFLRALGIAVTNDDIIELLGNSDVIKRTLERDTALTREDALIEIYRRLRPGEPPTVDASRSLLEGLLFNPQRYDLARVGRYKLNKKLKQLARRSALTYKAQAGAICVVEPISMDAPKTKSIVAMAEALKVADKKVLLVLPDSNVNLQLSCRNLPYVKAILASNVNTYEVMNASALVMVEGAENILNTMLA